MTAEAGRDAMAEDEAGCDGDACSLLRRDGQTPEARTKRAIVRARDVGEAVLWTLGGAHLSAAEREELALHAEAFLQLAEEMRAIVRGKRPPVGF